MDVLLASDVAIPLGCLPHSAHVACYGVRLTLRASSARLLREMRRRLPLGFTTARTARGRTFFARGRATRCHCGGCHDEPTYGDRRRTSRAMDEWAMLEMLRLRMWQYMVVHSARFVFVHAGVVAFGDRAVVLPADSMSGKTTLVSALLRAGGTYYSDEYAVFDRQGRIHPFAQPLGMRQPGSRQQTDVPASRLTSKIATQPTRASLIVSTAFVEGHTWAPTPMSRGDAVMALLAHSAGVRRAPSRGLSILSRAASQAVGLRGPRGDADATAARVVECLQALPQ